MKLVAGSSLLAAVAVLTVLMLALEADVTDAQRNTAAARRNRNNNRNNNNNSRNSNNSRGSAGRRRNRGRGRNRSRGGRRRQSRFERYGCEEIYLPMCKGLVPYTHTKLPNQFNHTTQAEVYRHLERLTTYMDHSCSRNVRLLACTTYLPKCRGRRQGLGPCRRTCLVAKRKCARPLNQQLGLEWDERFSCDGLPNSACVRPMRDSRCQHRYPTCVSNQPFSVCQNLTFAWGTLPNMFGQCHVQDINNELLQYASLQATNCHEHLNFMLCGVYSPFCVRDEVPFTFPCRELCNEIRTACEADYRRLNHNLPWPHKLQCHRYPPSESTDYECVMPSEGETFQASVGPE